MLSDLKVIKELLDTFGVATFLLLLMFGLWKVWPSLSKLAHWFATEYINQVKERVSTETEIEARLTTLADNLERSIEEIEENDKRASQRVNEIKSEFQERLQQIECTITQKIWPAISMMVGRMHKRASDHDETVNEIIARMKREGKTQESSPSLMVDTETFRNLRDQEIEEIKQQEAKNEKQNKNEARRERNDT